LGRRPRNSRRAAAAAAAAAAASAVLDGMTRVLAATGRSVWEVNNVWALAESELPVTWYYGEHDATIFDCHKALACESAPTRVS
jgi:pimeloyl-ACP methyl ester carboxylesterase